MVSEKVGNAWSRYSYQEPSQRTTRVRIHVAMKRLTREIKKIEVYEMLCLRDTWSTRVKERETHQLERDGVVS